MPISSKRDTIQGSESLGANDSIMPTDSELDFTDPAFGFDANLPPASSAWETNYPGAVQTKSTKQRLWWRRWRDGFKLSGVSHRLMPSPDWLISFAVHSAMLIGLAFVTISNQSTPVASLLVSQVGDGDSLVDELAVPSAESLATSSVSIESLILEDQDTPTLTSLQPEAHLDMGDATFSIGASAAASALVSVPAESIVAGRTGPAKLALLSKYGGTAKTEAAVKLGLEWLIKQQDAEGSWSFHGPYRDGAGFGENRNAATGMALIALLGAGHTHKSGQYRNETELAVKWLVKQQKSDGNLGADTPGNHAIYTHAIGTLALSECYAMTGDSWLRQYVERAVRYTLRAQGQEGGWRYVFRGDSDTSVTGWCVMALVSAKSAGIEVSETNLRHIQSYLNSVDEAEHSLYSYTKNRNPTSSMTAEGMLCRMYLGWSRSHPAINLTTTWLHDKAPFKSSELQYYYWYYATQVMHHAGGDDWKKWNKVMREQLPALQIVAGEEAGSWPPSTSGHDRSAGRLYSTCLALYCLEVYYRHMPLYER